MIISIAFETERIVRKEMRSGHFQAIDDLIVPSAEAWRGKNRAALAAIETPEKTLGEFFRSSPLVQLELNVT